jgi:hypothetical protein
MIITGTANSGSTNTDNNNFTVTTSITTLTFQPA